MPYAGGQPLNLILLFPTDFVAGTDRVFLAGRRRDHVRLVHRAAVGDELCVGLVGGRIGTGRIIHLNPEVLEMEVRLERLPPPKLPLTLILALPRPKVLRRVLRSAVSLGVERIVLLNGARVEKSYWQSPFLESEAMRNQVVLGLEQAKDTILPEVAIRPRFKPFIEDELPGISKGTDRLVAHPGAADSCPCNPGGPVTLVIGPEGGFLPYELERFVAAGFTPVRIGERTMTVETAVPALIARLF